jgi:hypothetical protein
VVPSAPELRERQRALMLGQSADGALLPAGGLQSRKDRRLCGDLASLESLSGGCSTA